MSSANSDVVALRPFLPASDFDISLRFYSDLGFTAQRLGEKLASMHLGPFGFLLQGDAWWAKIAALDLASRYGVQAPKLQPWGLMVAYLFDPSGVLWHIAQDRTSVPVP